MDWKNLFLTANGRIGQRDFWISWLILFVATWILGIVPVLGWIAAIALIYPTVCIFSKRLHDFGKSGWLAAVPYAVFLAGSLLGTMMGGVGLMAAASGGGAAAAGALAGMGMSLVLLLIALMIAIGFLLWVGLSKGDRGSNRFGPPPVAAIGASASPTSV